MDACTMNTPMALHAQHQVPNGHNRVEGRKYTWSYELEYYCRYFNVFNVVYLGTAIPMCWLAKSIDLKAETLGMTIVLLIIGGLSITIDQWTVERRNRIYAKEKYDLTAL